MSGKEHMIVGTTATATMGIGFLVTKTFDSFIYLIPLIIGGFIGSYMPDIDSHNSKARQVFNKILTFLIIAIVIGYILGVALNVTDIIRFLENNFKNPELNISSVCDAAGISDTNFRRRFQKTFGKRPKDYLLELRLGCAEQLLAQRCYTVEEAANLCGFSDAKYFSRVIKKRYGCPPSKLFLPQ